MYHVPVSPSNVNIASKMGKASAVPHSQGRTGGQVDSSDLS